MSLLAMLMGGGLASGTSIQTPNFSMETGSVFTGLADLITSTGNARYTMAQARTLERMPAYNLFSQDLADDGNISSRTIDAAKEMRMHAMEDAILDVTIGQDSILGSWTDTLTGGLNNLFGVS